MEIALGIKPTIFKAPEHHGAAEHSQSSRAHLPDQLGRRRLLKLKALGSNQLIEATKIAALPAPSKPLLH